MAIQIPGLSRGEMLAEPSSANTPDDLTTRERIKRAARRLFALNGVDAVTVRDIVGEAGGKNVSALNYYFGSKEELIETLIRDALAAANARLDRALIAVEATGGPKSVREIVEILVLRGLQPNAGDGDEASARFFATLLHTRRRLITDTVAKLEFSAYDRALRHIRRLMPPMPDGAKGQRLLFYFWASSSIFAVLEGALDENHSYAEPWSAPDPLGNFIDAAVAMLEAPLTSAIEDIRKGSSAPKAPKQGGEHEGCGVRATRRRGRKLARLSRSETGAGRVRSARGRFVDQPG
jgi:AcrR family transcriptional regulator